MKILGIDEAGRGCCIGPLVMCGYLIDERRLDKIKAIGAKDSKQLSDSQRRVLLPKLEKLADDLLVLRAEPHEITHINLNKLEIDKMQNIINSFDADRVIVDAIEANTKKFSRKLMSGVDDKKIELIAENYADSKYPEVSAASIVAKVRRDQNIIKLHREYGFFGSGYPNDPYTINFLRNWIKKNSIFPPIVRKKWITVKNLMKEKEQTKVGGFIDG